MARKIDFAQVAKLAQHVELCSVCWRDIATKRSVEQDQTPEKLSLHGQYTAAAHRDLPAEQIVVVARFELEVRSQDKEAVKVANIAATLSLRYGVPKDVLQQVGEDLAREFANTNGVYNAWPYWRELVQSMASRVGIHGIVAPVFRLFKSTSDNQEAAEDTPTETADQPDPS